MIREEEKANKDEVDNWIGVMKMLLNLDEARKERDLVNSPEHYQASNGMEAIEVIEAFGLNYNLGNAVKYILRSDKKGAAEEDIKKAIWYLKRERFHLQQKE